MSLRILHVLDHSIPLHSGYTFRTCAILREQRALGWTTINAHVIEVLTAVGAGRNLRLEDLPTKGHERVFAERVPLPPRMRARIELHRGEDFGTLAEMVEAWSFRYMQQRGRMLDRRDVVDATTHAGWSNTASDEPFQYRICGPVDRRWSWTWSWTWCRPLPVLRRCGCWSLSCSLVL